MHPAGITPQPILFKLRRDSPHVYVGHERCVRWAGLYAVRTPTLAEALALARGTNTCALCGCPLPLERLPA